MDRHLLVAAFVAGALPLNRSAPFAHNNDDTTWICKRKLDDKHVCGARFRSRAALLSHQFFYHKDKQPYSKVIVTNMCTVCESKLASVEAAKQHINASFASGHCRLDLGKANWKLLDPQHG